MFDFLFNVNPMDFLQAGIGDYIPGWDSLMDAIGLSDAYNETGSAINSFMVDLCNKNLISYGVKMSESLVGTARYLGAIFAICVAAGQAYKVMANGERFDVLSIMRPLIFAFVLSFWPAICTTLMMPGQQVEKYMQKQYVAVAADMESLRKQRFKFAEKVNAQVAIKKFSADKAKESTSILGKMKDTLVGYWDAIANIDKAVTNAVMIWVYSMVETIIQALGEMIFAINVYIVFMCKALYLTALMLFGPVYMVCSILDVWKNSWSEWVGRMVSVSFYGAMAYLVMTFACCLITMTLQADIDKLTMIAANPEMGMAGYMRGQFGTTIMTFIGYMVGAVAMSTVNELATFAFPGGILMGAGGFMKGVRSQAIKYTNTQKAF